MSEIKDINVVPDKTNYSSEFAGTLERDMMKETLDNFNKTKNWTLYNNIGDKDLRYTSQNETEERFLGELAKRDLILQKLLFKVKALELTLDSMKADTVNNMNIHAPSSINSTATTVTKGFKDMVVKENIKNSQPPIKPDDDILKLANENIIRIANSSW